MRRARQRVGSRTRPNRARGGCDFLVGHLIDAATLARAEAASHRAGVPTHHALVALGWLDAHDYAQALARHLGLALLDRELAPGARIHDFAEGAAVLARLDGAEALLIDAMVAEPDAIRRMVDECGWPSERTLIAPQSLLLQGIEAEHRRGWIADAVSGLARSAPDLSAFHGARRWQSVFVLGLLGVLMGASVILADGLLLIITLAAVPLFACATLVRAVALAGALGLIAEQRQRRVRRLRERDLPVYSILVPLYREARVLPGLVCALTALDYPAAKLDILLVLEADDIETQAAAALMDLPGNARIVVVPRGGPRTKPKALNYALNLVRGRYVVVYDAEDVPEPDQLRRALAAFAAGGADLACVQARLNVYNPRASWLTRQFALEYTAQFDALMPALVRLGVPLPLGGTSNHFPVDLLRRLGGWDPYNVTEDADLGIRIARAGLEARMLASTTWEEAPETFMAWMRQRTRWIKGWLQTYIVHTRQPVRLIADLGLARSLAFHLLMCAIALSALVHPLLYVILARQAWDGVALLAALSGGSTLAWIAIGNLVLGYAVTIALLMVVSLRRRRAHLVVHALLAPVYWLAISFAAWRAVWQLMREPFRWEKTEHGIARARELPSGPFEGRRRTREPGGA